MIKQWVTHLAKEDQEEFKQRILLAEPVLTRLSNILDQKLNTTVNDTLRVSSYSSPTWAYEQADHIGYSRALQEVITLLNLEK